MRPKFWCSDHVVLCVSPVCQVVVRGVALARASKAAMSARSSLRDYLWSSTGCICGRAQGFGALRDCAFAPVRAWYLCPRLLLPLQSACPLAAAPQCFLWDVSPGPLASWSKELPTGQSRLCTLLVQAVLLAVFAQFDVSLTQPISQCGK